MSQKSMEDHFRAVDAERLKRIYNGELEPGEPVVVVRRTTTLLEDIIGLIAKIIVIILLIFAALTFLFGASRYVDDSMAPAIQNGDLVFYYRLDKDYSIGQCCVLNYNGELQVRRVIAKTGDTVDIDAVGLLINGAYQQEEGIYTNTLPYKGGATFPITLREGEIFVLGDDRDKAIDGRVYGAIKAEETEGSVVTVMRRRGI